MYTSSYLRRFHIAVETFYSNKPGDGGGKTNVLVYANGHILERELYSDVGNLDNPFLEVHMKTFKEK